MADNPFGGLASGIQTGLKLRAAAEDDELSRQRLKQGAASQAALAKYRESQTAINQKKLEIQERNLDLTMAQRLTQVLSDQQMHPEARSFLLDEIITASGHDIKSERYQGLKKVLLKMPVDQANALADAIATGLPNAPAGSIRQMVDGLLKGQVSPGDIPKIVAGFGQQQARQEILGDPATQGTGIPDPNAPQDEGLPAIAGTVFEPGTQTQTPQQSGMPTTPQEARDRARRLGAEGDVEGARMMLQMARDMEGPQKPFESTESKQIAERDYGLLKSLDDDIKVVEKTDAAMQALDTAIEGGRFTPGSFSSIRQNISQIAEFVGLNPEDPIMKSLLGTGDPATAETIHAASNRIALDMADKLSKMTNMSLAFVQESVPNLARTPAGNRLIMDMIRAGNARTRKAHDIAEDMIAKHGTLRPPGQRSFQQRLRSLMDEPLFDDDFVKRVKEESRRGAGVDIVGGVEDLEGNLPTEGSKTIQGGGRTFEVVGDQNGMPIVKTQQGNFPIVRTTEQYDAMKPGDPFVWGPTGKLIRKK